MATAAAADEAAAATAAGVVRLIGGGGVVGEEVEAGTTTMEKVASANGASGKRRRRLVLMGLPEDVLLIVLGFLEARELCRFGETAKEATKLSQESGLWRHLYFTKWVKFSSPDNDAASMHSLVTSLTQRNSNLQAMLNPLKWYSKQALVQKEAQMRRDQAVERRNATILLHKKQRVFAPFLEALGWRLPVIVGGIAPSVSLFFLINNLAYIEEYEQIYGNSTNSQSSIFNSSEGGGNISSFGNQTFNNGTYLNETTTTPQPTLPPLPGKSNLSDIQPNGNFTTKFIPWVYVFAPLDIWFGTLLISLIAATFLFLKDYPTSIFYGLSDNFQSLLRLSNEIFDELDTEMRTVEIIFITWAIFICLCASVCLITVKLEFAARLPLLSWTLVYMPTLLGFVIFGLCEYTIGARKFIKMESRWAVEWLMESLISIGILLIALKADAYVDASKAVVFIPFWIFWSILIIVGLVATTLDPIESPYDLIGRLIFLLILFCFPSSLVAISLNTPYGRALVGPAIIFCGTGALMVYVGVFGEAGLKLRDPPPTLRNFREFSDDDDLGMQRESANDDEDYHPDPSFFFPKKDDVDAVITRLTNQARIMLNPDSHMENEESFAEMLLMGVGAGAVKARSFQRRPQQPNYDFINSLTVEEVVPNLEEGRGSGQNGTAPQNLEGGHQVDASAEGELQILLKVEEPGAQVGLQENETNSITEKKEEPFVPISTNENQVDGEEEKQSDVLTLI